MFVEEMMQTFSRNIFKDELIESAFRVTDGDMSKGAFVRYDNRPQDFN